MINIGLTGEVSSRYKMIVPKGKDLQLYRQPKESMNKTRLIKIVPRLIAYADSRKNILILEFAIPGAPTDTIDVMILQDCIHLTAPARDIEYVSALVLSQPMKPEIVEATYENGLLRIEVPFKDPIEDTVKVIIRAGGMETKAECFEA